MSDSKPTRPHIALRLAFAGAIAAVTIYSWITVGPVLTLFTLGMWKTWNDADDWLRSKEPQFPQPQQQ